MPETKKTRKCCVKKNTATKKQIPNKNVDGIQTSILDEEIDIHQNRLSLLLSEYFTCCDHDRKVQLQNQSLLLKRTPRIL